ncbi:MAG: patatin-like phospholipase family protein [Bacteroidales bacterium]|nr:patatin-like phospholipase family protein [Bacteroidales bacterium]
MMKKNVSLVLSSGGARGVAHIGAIEELERQGYNITSIAGTSMGALVGGVYATGKLPEYKEWLSSLDKLDVFKMVDFTFSTSGLVKGDKIFNEMRKLVPETNIEDLKIPFTAIATDIINKKEVIFTKGDLFEAIRASISIPSVFTPFQKHNSLLIDGGVLNPLPVNRVKRSDNDILVVVNVNALIPSYKKNATEPTEKKNGLMSSELFKGIQNKLSEIMPKNKKEKLGYFDLITETIGLMLYQISALTLQNNQPDVVINISRQACGNYDFYRAEELIEIGRKAAIKGLKEFNIKY